MIEKQPSRQEKQPHSLSEQDKEQISKITLGIDDVPDDLARAALPDLIGRLETNSHPLNRVWRDENGEIVGYVVFDDGVEKGYIKYFGTNKAGGLSPFTEIPKVLEEAKKLGYQQLSFHGWNPKLNKILGRFGFERKGTENWGGERVNYYVLSLNGEKEKKQETPEDFQAKQLQKILRDIEEFKTKHLGGRAEEISRKVKEVKNRLLARIERESDLNFSEIAKANLELKLLRYFQANESIDENTLFDAVIETPKFFNKSKGSLERLFEIHQQKTLMRIAEMRKKRAEQTGHEGFNPFENLFETSSGNYYMARLLNMPHLEEESEYMGHCVGTSDSYINRIKKGEIEILSFRLTPKYDKESGKLQGDAPLLTIEYDLKEKRIEQIKGPDDELLTGEEEYFQEFLEALALLEKTKNDFGENREIRGVENFELIDISIGNDQLLTTKGFIDGNEFSEDVGTILKMGQFTERTSDEKFTEIINAKYGTHYEIGEIARTPEEIDENTRFYPGSLGESHLDILREKIKNPFRLGGHLFLPNPKITENLTFPQTVDGDLDLGWLRTAENQTLPQTVGGYLNLWKLHTAENLTFPQSVGDSLNLRSLEYAKDLTLPQTVGGYLDLRDLQTAEGLNNLPETINGDIYLNSLSAEEKEKLAQRYPQHREKIFAH